MTKDFLRGFIKAAVEKNLTKKDFGMLLKKAFDEEKQYLNSDDIATLRSSMSRKGITPPYDDPYGEKSRLYNAHMLNERDRNADKVPEMEAAMAGLGKGVVGAGIGGAAGAGVGTALRDSKLLNAPWSVKKHLPIGVGVSSAVLGAIIASLPSAKKRYDEVKALQKLNVPRNMNQLVQNTGLDTSYLNS